MGKCLGKTGVQPRRRSSSSSSVEVAAYLTLRSGRRAGRRRLFSGEAAASTPGSCCSFVVAGRQGRGRGEYSWRRRRPGRRLQRQARHGHARLRRGDEYETRPPRRRRRRAPGGSGDGGVLRGGRARGAPAIRGDVQLRHHPGPPAGRPLRVVAGEFHLKQQQDR